MVNVLGTLFSDIATAIRNKTGDTATMKPAEFPAKIDSIVTGAVKTWKVEEGEFTSTATARTIQHNLGVTPDMVIVAISDPPSAGGGAIIFAFGLPNAVISATGGNITNTIVGASASLTYNKGIDDSNNMMESYGMIRDATTTEFTVGGGNCPLENGKQYVWYAISGII